MRVEDGFQPVYYDEDQGNTYTSDPVISSLLRRILPSSTFTEIETDLIRLGADIVTKIRPLGSKISKPELIQYDQWGRRVDVLLTSEGWRSIKVIVQREGIPAIFYERTFGEYSRVFGFAKALLLVGDTHGIFCPLSMTDGTARVIELTGSTGMKKHIFPRLISRDPSIAYVSGQWMTERPGGSDVSQTETTAQSLAITHELGQKYLLNGFKWFSSATDGDVAVALARTGTASTGSKGLSLFLIPLRIPFPRAFSDPIPSPVSNNILVHRLKNKIGTHALPTAELSLEGSEAFLLGPINQGVKNISPVLNITRVWSAISSVGALRKCLAIATAFAHGRAIQGGKTLLRDSPIHVSCLASINLTYRALTHLIFGVVQLLGKAETGSATLDEQARLRLLTPTIKAFASQLSLEACQDAMVALGGAGYMEENDVGRLIRDALVERIWEGTPTVMALDLLRSARDPTILKSLISWAQSIMATCPSSWHSKLGSPLTSLDDYIHILSTIYEAPVPVLLPPAALKLIGYVAAGIFLFEHAVWSYTTGQPESATDIEAWSRWVRESGIAAAAEDVQRVKSDTKSENRFDADTLLVFGHQLKPKL